MEAAEFVRRYPCAWHMTEDGQWPSIRARGLLCTSALLDLYGVAGAERAAVEESRRPGPVVLRRAGRPDVVIRDQMPLSDAGLRRCLSPGMAPCDWYRLLNGMAFFWLSEARLFRLLNARPYRDAAHTVLTVSTESLVRAHGERIRLCPINSGNTRRLPQPRGPETFLPIRDYPFEWWRRRRGDVDAVVELAVPGGVPDIERHTLTVGRMRVRRCAVLC